MSIESDRGPWANRAEAGRELGDAVRTVLAERSDANPPAGDRPLVLGLPRGGVEVAAAVADVVNGDLDVLVVRKAGVPWHRELALGAVTASGMRVHNTDVIAMSRVTDDDLEKAFERAEREAHEREHELRAGRPAAGIAGRVVVITDDGVATGATALAAAQSISGADPPPARVILAVPVAPPSTVRRLSRHVDTVVTMREPEDFMAVGEWFIDFTQVEDDQVRELLLARR
ncbi:phosphoribosyltransferase [Phytoactinopolyspora alkaliphila]|uniref:Phosphoribosyltransferase n=1 Tax=Phytoactinopolyspora alkaliphila TaxID=1783498 RepID=A0A6N9YLN8_9ACTN|nr:phosphoribosyltransferase family protein [Phytoactinopolyspora alkaliphila]NED95894.1 phosphoribosyltransferase [Phytoactinopolyspora alkaliphila]